MQYTTENLMKYHDLIRYEYQKWSYKPHKISEYFLKYNNKN